MSAGTLTLTNNSAAVTGSGTAFTTELTVGDFIVVTVGGIPYTLAIKTVNSNTSLTLVSNYTGPTQGGAAWYAVPRVAMNLVTAALVAQSAEALRGLNYDKQNWQRLFSASGNITVTLPDGSSFTGPSWQYMVNTVATKTNGAVPVNQGGTGATDAATARKNLELSDAAIRIVLTAPDYPGEGLMARGYFGWGAYIAHPGGNDGRYNEYSGIYRGPGDGGVQYFDNFAPMLVMSRYQGVYGMLQIAPTTGRAAVRGRSGNNFSAWNELYTTGNTTKASDGTLKAASPVARIVASQEACQRADIAEAGFEWCGCGTANAEAEGITLSRLDIGVYMLTGSAGLASEGWQLLPPMDPGGMGELGVVEAEQTESGGLTIRLFKRKYMLGDEGEIVKAKGEPMDVPVNSWIDVRLDMPENSIWNQRQKESAEPSS
ncbi:TPA: phage tail protein [Enterobacter hormaechei subsp. xiangfangensis]|nr:phage tail protein [Enterobacter hormaechei subsp. xiangfangensis]HBM2784012.1 phage tail protein [Enterobacter hormaechei subsp. xiangfangensis]HBM2822250.1 phage tail protein [Enterobacter hormaechei subsp. xiangfangensis]HBM2835828.1 phage tail protein [Enterobacter hormaechei subsp. xiangfangensis]